MTITNINSGDVYITDGTVNANNTITTTGNQKVVHIIPTTKIDWIYDNQLIVLPIPVSKGDRGDTPFSRIVDLKRIKETITVTGFLADESRSDGVADSAFDKREDLLTIGKLRNVLSVVWGTKFGTNTYQTIWKQNVSSNNYGAFIFKMTFTETQGRLGEAVNTGLSQLVALQKSVQLFSVIVIAPISLE